MPAGRTAAHDPDATGPRDWTELAEYRAAHAVQRHSALRAILDAQRIRALAHRPIVTRDAYRALPDRYHEAHAAYRIAAAARRIVRASDGHNDDRNTEARTTRAAAAAAIARARAALRAAHAAAADERRPWPVAPCAAPRCTGHATVTDAGALRAEARHLHPIPRRTAAAA